MKKKEKIIKNFTLRTLYILNNFTGQLCHNEDNLFGQHTIRETRKQGEKTRYRDREIMTERREKELKNQRYRDKEIMTERRERELLYLNEEGNLVGEHTAGHQTHRAGPTQNRQSLDKKALLKGLIRIQIKYNRVILSPKLHKTFLKNVYLNTMRTKRIMTVVFF